MYDLRLVSLHSIAQQEIFRAIMEMRQEKSMKHEKNNILKTTAKLKMYMRYWVAMMGGGSGRRRKKESNNLR